jgi:hypothetical protein
LFCLDRPAASVSSKDWRVDPVEGMLNGHRNLSVRDEKKNRERNAAAS